MLAKVLKTGEVEILEYPVFIAYDDLQYAVAVRNRSFVMQYFFHRILEELNLKGAMMHTNSASFGRNSAFPARNCGLRFYRWYGSGTHGVNIWLIMEVRRVVIECGTQTGLKKKK